MIANLILISRTRTPSHLIDELYGPQRVHIPKAPALGLLLEEPVFTSYNLKISDINAKVDSGAQPEDNRRPLLSFDPHREDMARFKQQFIYDKIWAQEAADATYGPFPFELLEKKFMRLLSHSFEKWIRDIDLYSGQDLLFLNPKGIIPPSAVIKLGEERRNAFWARKQYKLEGGLPGGHAESDDEAGDVHDDMEG